MAMARPGDGSGALEVELLGERMLLMPERAAFWRGSSTLLVADAHIGKAATFRAAGLAVPGGTTAAGLSRLASLLDATGAERLVFLGDLFHAREGHALATRAALAEWRQRHAAVDVVLVRGNHDRRAGDPHPSIGIRCVDAPLHAAPFTFRHHPDPTRDAYTIAGHLHPAVRLAGRARQRRRLPCFWLGRDVAVLPSFGDFTGAADVHPRPDDRVFVIAEEQVLPVE